jgi:hypothetical protein
MPAVNVSAPWASGLALRPAGYEELTVAGSPVGLANAADAEMAEIHVEGGPIRVTWHPGGVPASGGPGFLYFDGDRLPVSGFEARALQAIRDGVTNGTLRVTYYKGHA